MGSANYLTRLNMNMNDILLVNEAGLIIRTNVSNLSLWAQAVDCFECDLIKLSDISEDKLFTFNTISRWDLELRSANASYCRNTNAQFGENGIYEWNYTNSCEPIRNIRPPVDSFRPVYVFESVLLTFFVLKLLARYFGPWFMRRICASRLTREVERDLGSPSEAQELLRSSSTSISDNNNNRIKSLDVFRGFTICLMIFVNYGGGQYWFFKHSPWNGLTVADVVFPWFAWIMGVGIAIKIKFDKRNGVPIKNLVFQCLRRSFMLIVFGLILTNLRNNDLEYYRFYGVLQRLGISYCFVTLLEIIFMEPHTIQTDNLYFNYIRDLSESWKQWCVVSLCIIFHTCITFFSSVPGCPQGYLGPGGLADHGRYFNCTGGAAGYIDRLFFGEKHIYRYPTCQMWYRCSIPYDPEGALGTLTAILCVYFGVHAGRIILVYRRSSERVGRWLLDATCCIILTLILTLGSVNEGPIPINKNLWSLSYVLLCCGLAFIVFSMVYLIVDEKKWFSATSLRKVGRQSLVLYVGHVIFQNVFPWSWKVHEVSSHTEYFLMNTWGTVLWVLIGRYSDIRVIFPSKDVSSNSAPGGRPHRFSSETR